MSRLSPTLTIMEAAARKAGRGLIRDFNEVEHLQVSKKGPADFVSAADRRADKVLREELQKGRPGAGFLTEEGADVEGDGIYRWIVDPLDGTTNFLHAVPHFAISIALEREKEVIAALVYQPLYDEIYWAEKGDGAFSTRGRLRVSARKNMSDCLLATGIPWKGHGDMTQFTSEMESVAGEVSGIRRMGSAALDLAYVAAGRFDGFWERGLKPWDIAAGLLLVTEAGGYVYGFDGKPVNHMSPDLVAANTQIMDPLLGLLTKNVATGGVGDKKLA